MPPSPPPKLPPTGYSRTRSVEEVDATRTARPPPPPSRPENVPPVKVEHGTSPEPKPSRFPGMQRAGKSAAILAGVAAVGAALTQLVNACGTQAVALLKVHKEAGATADLEEDLRRLQRDFARVKARLRVNEERDAYSESLLCQLNGGPPNASYDCGASVEHAVPQHWEPPPANGDRLPVHKTAKRVTRRPEDEIH